MATDSFQWMHYNNYILLLPTYYSLKEEIFQNKADSYFTTQRLNYIANQTEYLRPQIVNLKNVDVAQITEDIAILERNARNLLRSVRTK